MAGQTPGIVLPVFPIGPIQRGDSPWTYLGTFSSEFGIWMASYLLSLHYLGTCRANYWWLSSVRTVGQPLPDWHTPDWDCVAWTCTAPCNPPCSL